MRKPRLEEEPAAPEAPGPFLFRLLGSEALDAELRRYRYGLRDLAIGDEETVDIDHRICRVSQYH